ncbi:sugar phosphate isomerase/epimerase [bacterium]|nr:sugar phosphate isomerase/epimerase [bacterium]
MFKKSINYWSFEGGLAGTRPVREVLVQAKEAGFDAVELCLGDTGDVSLETTEESAGEILQSARDMGIEIASVATGLFWGKSLTANDPKVREDALVIGRKLVEVAAWLDAGAVLVIPGAVDIFFDPNSEVVPYGKVWDRATEAVGKLAEHAKTHRIAIGLENVWNKFLVGPMEMKMFIDQFHSEWVGAYFDVGNCMVNGYPEHWIEILGERIKRVHFKDFRRAAGTLEGFVDLLAGDVNWPGVIEALKKANYSGYVTAEMIPLYRHYPGVLVENTSRAMDEIIGR